VEDVAAEREVAAGDLERGPVAEGRVPAHGGAEGGSGAAAAIADRVRGGQEPSPGGHTLSPPPPEPPHEVTPQKHSAFTPPHPIATATPSSGASSRGGAFDRARPRIDLRSIGEAVDTVTPFAEQDAERRRYLDEQLRREDAARNKGKGRATYEKTCPKCGDPFVAHNATREVCSPCRAAGRNHYEVTITRSANRKRRTPGEVAPC
jgi:ribosomal protein S27AE